MKEIAPELAKVDIRNDAAIADIGKQTLRKIIIEQSLTQLLAEKRFGTDVSTDWMEAGACRGMQPALYILDEEDSSEQAKETCRKCDVRIDCLEFALVKGEKFGVLGGLAEAERRKLRPRWTKARKAAAKGG